MKEKTRESIIWVVIFLMFVAAATIGACSANAALTQQEVVITIKSDSTAKKADVKVGKVRIEKEDGTVEVKELWRGPRGGYFYYTGKTTKSGKPEKKYLSKEEKRKYNLK